MAKKTQILLKSVLALAGAAGLGLLAASCASQAAPAPSASAKTGDLVWVDTVLYLTAPDGLNANQKMILQNHALALPAFVVGLGYAAEGVRVTLDGRNEIALRGTVLGEAYHRDGLGIWRLETQAGLPAAGRSLPVLRTISVEAVTDDPELAPQAVKGQYPANRLLLTLANRAVREVVQSGNPSGHIRLARLQYDSGTGRFRAKFEILN